MDLLGHAIAGRVLPGLPIFSEGVEALLLYSGRHWMEVQQVQELC